jgi:hypothetical protein
MNRPGLHWQLISRDELANRLDQGGLQDTRDVDGSTLYEFTFEQQAQLAVVLPGGQCLLIAPAGGLPATDRRRHGG